MTIAGEKYVTTHFANAVPPPGYFQKANRRLSNIKFASGTQH
jgi:hypothetical protein